MHLKGLFPWVIFSATCEITVRCFEPAQIVMSSHKILPWILWQINVSVDQTCFSVTLACVADGI